MEDRYIQPASGRKNMAATTKSEMINNAGNSSNAMNSHNTGVMPNITNKMNSGTMPSAMSKHNMGAMPEMTSKPNTGVMPSSMNPANTGATPYMTKPNTGMMPEMAAKPNTGAMPSSMNPANMGATPYMTKPNTGMMPEMTAKPNTGAMPEMTNKADALEGAEADTTGCGYKSGELPPCAPLAAGFVPFQQKNPPKYQSNEALTKGTLFPGLDLPFMNIANETNPYAGTPLGELMALGFVIKELNLYLDTHKNDKEALDMLKTLNKLMQEGRQKYVEMYGPQSIMDITTGDEYTWLNNPWPWEYTGRGAAK